MKTQTKHTPVRFSTIALHNPYRSQLVRKDGSCIARIEFLDDDDAESFAQFLVTACNCHEELVRTLERLTEKTQRANSIQHSGGTIIAEDWSELYQLTNEARAALAKVRVTEERP